MNPKMVPECLPYPNIWIKSSSVLFLIASIGMLFKETRKMTGYLLIPLNIFVSALTIKRLTNKELLPGCWWFFDMIDYPVHVMFFVLAYTSLINENVLDSV